MQLIGKDTELSMVNLQAQAQDTEGSWMAQNMCMKWCPIMRIESTSWYILLKEGYIERVSVPTKNHKVV